VWKLRKFSVTLFWQKFRESNVFTIEIINELISRNFFSVRESLLFPHCIVYIIFFVKSNVICCTSFLIIYFFREINFIQFDNTVILTWNQFQTAIPHSLYFPLSVKLILQYKHFLREINNCSDSLPQCHSVEKTFFTIPIFAKMRFFPWNR